MLDLAKNANLALAFAVELAMLATLVTWGLSLDTDVLVRWAAAAVAVAVIVVIWAVWAAPNSSTRLGMPGLLILKIALFAVATLALWAADRPVLGAWFGGIAALNLVLAAIWDQQ